MKKIIPTGGAVSALRRRYDWLLYGLTLRKAWNLLVSGIQYVLKTDKAYNFPAIVKIDISPSCNLRCPSCVHAAPGEDPKLQAQDYTGNQRMDIPKFTEIINQIKDRSSAVSLYYLGDPLIHPQLDEMARIARDAGLGVHISTNFSFRLSDERIKSLVTSGITHFSASVDGLVQKDYALTRVGGRLDLVLDNMERLCRFKREMGLKYPIIEAQYIKFQHNADKVEAAEKILMEMGVNTFTPFWGVLHSYVDMGPDRFEVQAPKDRKALPHCTWPHFNTVIKYNGDVIACCWFREGEQYTADGDMRTFGNVFKTPLKEIWRSPKYDMARAIVNDPKKASGCSDSEGNFCHGCSLPYKTTRNANRRTGEHYGFDELYTLGRKGIPIRRPETASHSTDQNALADRK